MQHRRSHQDSILPWTRILNKFVYRNIITVAISGYNVRIKFGDNTRQNIAKLHKPSTLRGELCSGKQDVLAVITLLSRNFLSTHDWRSSTCTHTYIYVHVRRHGRTPAAWSMGIARHRWAAYIRRNLNRAGTICSRTPGDKPLSATEMFDAELRPLAAPHVIMSFQGDRRNRFHTMENPTILSTLFSSPMPPLLLSFLPIPSFKGRGACFMRQAKCAIFSPHLDPRLLYCQFVYSRYCGIETDCNFAAFRISMFDICRHMVMSIYFICDTGNVPIARAHVFRCEIETWALKLQFQSVLYRNSSCRRYISMCSDLIIHICLFISVNIIAFEFFSILKMLEKSNSHLNVKRKYLSNNLQEYLINIQYRDHLTNFFLNISFYVF